MLQGESRLERPRSACRVNFYAPTLRGVVLNFFPRGACHCRGGGLRPDPTRASDATGSLANQEVAYLLQRIECYGGLVILAPNRRANIDDAFVRRLQAIIPFPMPSPEERYEIWRKTFPPQISIAGDVDWRGVAARHELTGANILNVTHFCAIEALAKENEASRFEMPRSGDPSRICQGRKSYIGGEQRGANLNHDHFSVGSIYRHAAARSRVTVAKQRHRSRRLAASWPPANIAPRANVARCSLFFGKALSSTIWKASVARAWSKYPPAEPGALVMWPLEAAVGVADATP